MAVDMRWQLENHAVQTSLPLSTILLLTCHHLFAVGVPVYLFFESLDDDMIIAISSTAFVVEIIESTSFILLKYTNLLLTHIMG